MEEAETIYRVIMTFGEGVPTRVFGGDYETRKQAERAKRNVEKTTHYRATIEEIEQWARRQSSGPT